MCSWPSTAQEVSIRFVPWCHDHELILGQEELVGSVPVVIEKLRFYISHLSLQQGDSVVKVDGAYLLDAADRSNLEISTEVSEGAQVDTLTFLLGVDSATNVSGALGGALDPSKGMYWTWNSGYINLKLEGSSPMSKEVKNAFNLHLGGYLPPHQSAQWVRLPVSSSGEIIVRVDVAHLLDHVDLSQRANVMSPGADAVELSRVAATCFKIADHE